MPFTIIKEELTTAEYKVENETHTVGNLIVKYLLENQNVIFAAYKVNHPSDNHFYLNIQVKDEFDPKSIFDETLSTIEVELNNVVQNIELEETRQF